MPRTAREFIAAAGAVQTVTGATIPGPPRFTPAQPEPEREKPPTPLFTYEFGRHIGRGLVDRRHWGRGQWDDEPDEMRWPDPETGFELLIRRTMNGTLNGYVGIPPGHKAHGLNHDCFDYDVHGGVNFTGELALLAGRNWYDASVERLVGAVWWVGFDCAHSLDYIPGWRDHMDLMMRQMRSGLSRQIAYRDFRYVEGEVRNLARFISDQYGPWLAGMRALECP